MSKKGLLNFAFTKEKYDGRQVAGKWLSRSVVAFAISSAVGVSGAKAQGSNPLPWDDLTEPASYVSFDVEGSDWELFPVIASDDSLVGFFGHLPYNQVVGNNVSLLWLVPDNGDGTWSMYGWSHTDLKFVSNYLDDLTGTEKVLADTGLDIYSNNTQQISQPKSMPNGIAEDDPAAPIVAATGDPLIASALIAVGAAGAPNLTEAVNLQPADCQDVSSQGGGNFSNLDVMMATFSRDTMSAIVLWASDSVYDSIEMAGLDDGQELALRCCFPRYVTVWLAFTPWTCTNSTPFLNGTGTCRCTGCTRTRPGTRYWVWPDCSTTTGTPVTDTQGPQEINGPVNPNGTCATCP